MHCRLKAKLGFVRALLVPTLLGLPLSGCLFDDNSESFGGPLASGEGRLLIVWDVFALEDTRPLSCIAVGATKVEVRVTPEAGGPGLTRVFACEASGQEMVVPAGRYLLSVVLKNALGQVLSTVSLPDVRTGAVDVWPGALTQVTVYFLIQSFALSWSIEWQDAPGVSISCAAARAAKVRLETARAGDVGTSIYDFPCTDYEGATPAVPTGSYTVRVWLLSAADTVLSLTEPLLVVAGDSTRALLPPVVFSVNRP